MFLLIYFARTCIISSDDFLCLFNKNYIMARAKANKNKGQSSFKYEEIVQLCLVDLLNGLSRNEIMQKLQENLYEGHDTSSMCRSTKYYILQECYDRCKMELAENMDKQRELFYNRLLAVYNECMITNDRQNALKALDMFAKFGQLYPRDEKKVEVTQTDGNIKITFGFSDDN